MLRAPNDTNRTKGQRNVQKLAERLFAIDSNSNKIEKARIIIEKLFWIAVYLNGFILTALTCKDLYEQYQANPVSIAISTLHNETMLMPNATVCLPFFEAEKLIDEIIFFGKLGEPDTAYVWSFVEELNAFFGNYTSWIEMQDADWTAPTLYIAQTYLSMIYEVEAMQGNSNNALQHLINNYEDTNISLAIANIFLPQMKEWKVTLGEFRDTFALKFKEFFPITIYFNDTIRNIGQELVFVTKHQVCFKLGLDDINLTMESNNISLQLNNSQLKYRNHNGFFCSTGPEPVTIDISGKARAGSITREFDSMFIAQVNVHTIVAFTPVLKYVGIHMCSSEETAEICQGRCRNNTIMKLCDCTAITVPSQQSPPETGCLIGQYENCLLNFTGIEDSHCMQQCQDACTYWQNDANIDRYVYMDGIGFDNSNSDLTVIDITVSTFTYLIFTESSVWRLDAIIGVIGGALGFWMGLDIITIVYTILATPVFVFIGRFLQITSLTTAELGESGNVAHPKKLFEQSWNVKDPVFAKWVVGKLTWSLLFLSGAGVTLWMFVQLCWSMYDTTSTVAVQLNTTMTLPKSALCTTVGNTTDVFDDFIQSEFDDYINQNMSKEIFLGKQSWPQSLTFIAFIYLRALFAIKSNEQFSGVDISMEFNTLRFRRNILLKYSITNEEIEVKFGIEFMKLKNITVLCNNTYENESFLFIPVAGTVEKSPMDLSERPLSICLDFPLQSFEYQTVDDYCLISVGNDMVSVDMYSKMGSYFLAFKSANSYVYSADVPFNKNQRLDVTFGYSSIYQNFVNCVTMTSPIDCFKKCREVFEAKMCQTGAITSNITAQEISLDALRCSWKEYSNCLISASAILAVKKQCNEECLLSPCINERYYAFASTASTKNSIYFQELKILFQNFEYTLTTENWLYSKQDFIAASGGLLGFLLGLDCTFLVSVIFTPLMFLAGALLKLRTTADENEQEQITSGYFTLFGFAKFLRVETAQKHRFFVMKALFERLFWLAVFVLFGTVTLEMTVDFCQQYNTPQISSNFQTMNNKTFEIPSISVCVPSWFKESYNQRAAKQDLKYISELSGTMLHTYIFNSNLTWPSSLLRTASQYLVLVEGYKTMEKVELSIIWSAYKANNNSDNNKNFPQFMNSVNITKAVDLLGTNLELMNITSNDLMQKFGFELRRKYPVNVTKYVKSTGLIGQTVSIDRTTFVSATTVCYDLPSKTLSFDSIYDYVALTTHLPNKPFMKSNECFEATFGYTFSNYLITVDLLGRGIPSTDQFSLGSYFSQHTSTAIKIGEVINMLSNIGGVTRCSKTISKEECMRTCRIKTIEQQCHCTLFDENRMYATDNSESKYCSWTRFKKCLPNFSLTNASICTANCLPSCERIHYVTNLFVKADRNGKIYGCNSEHLFSVSHFPYQFYTEQLDGSFFSFVAGLGGTLGILVGIDVIMSIEFCFSLTQWFYSVIVWLKSSRNEENDANPERRPIRIITSKNVVHVQPHIELQ